MTAHEAPVLERSVGDVTVGVVDGPHAAAVTDQLRTDGFVVASAWDGASDIVVLCWAQVTNELLARVGQLRDVGGRALIAVVEDVPTPHLMRVMSARLDGVVMLDAILVALRPTVMAIAAGQSCHPLAFREQLERPLLSAREKQVLAMVVLGLANLEIARKLVVTEASVKAHLTSAFAKLGVRSREAAAALILDPEAGYGPGILRITADDGEDVQR